MVLSLNITQALTPHVTPTLTSAVMPDFTQPSRVTPTKRRAGLDPASAAAAFRLKLLLVRQK